MTRVWGLVERIGLFVMTPFVWLAQLLLEVPEVEHATGRIVEWLAKRLDR